MAELTIRPEEIRDALQRFVQSYEPDAAAREEIGSVTYSGDGIARVSGLPSAMANELLEFEDGTQGIAQNLESARSASSSSVTSPTSRKARKSSAPARSSPSR